MLSPVSKRSNYNGSRGEEDYNRSVAPAYQQTRFPSHHTAANRSDEAHTKPRLLCPLPDFEEHFKTMRDTCRQFLRKLEADVQLKPDTKLDNTRSQKAIEAACLLRGKMIASVTKDAQLDADRKTIQTTWGILQSWSHTFALQSTHVTQTDMDQLKAFLFGSTKVKSALLEEKDAKVTANYSTTPSALTDYPTSVITIVPAADADTSAHMSFHDAEQMSLSAVARGHTGTYEPLPHIFPPVFSQDTDNTELISSLQMYLEPYVYEPNSLQTSLPQPPNYQNETHEYGLSVRGCSGASVNQPSSWYIDSEILSASQESEVLQTHLHDPRNVVNSDLPDVSHPRNTSDISSDQVKQASRGVKVRDKRQRRHATMLRPIAPIGSAPDTGSSVDEIEFHNFTPQTALDAERNMPPPFRITSRPHRDVKLQKRKLVTEEEQADTDTAQVRNNRVQRPVNVGGIEGKRWNALVMETKPREGAGS